MAIHHIVSDLSRNDNVLISKVRLVGLPKGEIIYLNTTESPIFAQVYPGNQLSWKASEYPLQGDIAACLKTVLQQYK